MEKATAEARTGRAMMAAPKNLRPDLLQRPMSVPEFLFTVMIAKLDCWRVLADCLAASHHGIGTGNA